MVGGLVLVAGIGFDNDGRSGVEMPIRDVEIGTGFTRDGSSIAKPAGVAHSRSWMIAR